MVVKPIDDGLERPGDARFVAVPDFLGRFNDGLKWKLAELIKDLILRRAVDTSSGEEFTKLDQVTKMAWEEDGSSSSGAGLEDGSVKGCRCFLTGVVHNMVPNLETGYGSAQPFACIPQYPDVRNRNSKGPRREPTECAPALSPIMVTLSGSPPKAFTFSLTHSNIIV